MELGKGQLEYTATHTSHVGLHKADQDSLEKSLKWEMVFSIEKLKIKNKTTPPLKPEGNPAVQEMNRYREMGHGSRTCDPELPALCLVPDCPPATRPD